MTKNNSRQTTPISKKPVHCGQISQSSTAHGTTTANKLMIIFFLLLTFTFIYAPSIAVAEPNNKTTDTTAGSSQTEETDKANQSQNNAEAVYAGPKEYKRSSGQKNNESIFNNTDFADLGSSVNDSDGEKSPAKKTTVTSEALLNLDYDDPGDQKKDSNFFASFISGATSVIRYILSIAFVLALGILAIYGVKFFNTKYGTLTGAGGDLLNVLEVKHIAPGKAICLVEVAGKVLILSMAGNSINHLSDISEQDKVEALKRAAEDNKAEPLQPFQAMLEKVTNRYTERKTKQRTGTEKSSNKLRTGETRVGHAENVNEWHDELHTTGASIRKLLDEIAEKDRPVKKARSSVKRNRGGERK